METTFNSIFDTDTQLSEEATFYKLKYRNGTPWTIIKRKLRQGPDELAISFENAAILLGQTMGLPVCLQIEAGPVNRHMLNSFAEKYGINLDASLLFYLEFMGWDSEIII